MKPVPAFEYPIHPLLQKRWSPRAFSEKPVTEQDVKTLLEAARWAASSENEQPWRFVWSFNDGSDLYKKLFDCLIMSNQEWAITAPLLMLSLVDKHFVSDGKPNHWAKHDLGLAMGNLTFQATDMGIYVHHIGGFSTEKVHAYFPKLKGLRPVTMTAIGYLGDSTMLSELNKQLEKDVQIRKPLSEIDLTGMML